MTANDFKHGNWHLFAAMDALMAYDIGCRDSGVKDDRLKGAVKDFLLGLSNEDFRRVLGEYARGYLTDEAMNCGYGLEDLLGFARWLSDELHIDI